MLILSRKLNESIMIGDKIEVSIVDIKGDQVKIGIKAPSDVKVYRQEVYQAIQQENIKATKTNPEILPLWDKLVGQKDANIKKSEPTKKE